MDAEMSLLMANQTLVSVGGIVTLVADDGYVVCARKACI